MNQVKKIIVPTDFSLQSLQLIDDAMNSCNNSKVDIVIAYGIKLSSSISDLLFMSKRRLIDSLATPEFKEMCRIIQSKYQSRLRTMHIDLLTSDNQNYIESYLEGNKIDTICFPEKIELKINKSKGFDICRALMNHRDMEIERAYSHEIKLVQAFE